MSLLRRRAVDPLAGALDPVYPPPPPEQNEPVARPVDPAPPPAGPRRRPPPDPEAPTRLRRAGTSMGEVRRRVLPLPDEVVEEFLGDGEQVIHSDHPSFRSFAVENTLLFLGFFVVAVLFLGITFNGSLMASGLLLIGLAVVFLILVLKRLGDRYTSYVVTDTRIMQIQGIVSRRAHSIPWVRVTDLTVDQSLMGRLFGYATLHIESANEDSGLRDLDGVSDPMRFNKVVVDMVVAKQGTTQPAWVAAGEVPPPTTRGSAARADLAPSARRDGVVLLLRRAGSRAGPRAAPHAGHAHGAAPARRHGVDGAARGRSALRRRRRARRARRRGAGGPAPVAARRAGRLEPALARRRSPLITRPPRRSPWRPTGPGGSGQGALVQGGRGARRPRGTPRRGAGRRRPCARRGSSGRRPGRPG